MLVKEEEKSQSETSMSGSKSSTAAPLTSSLAKLQSLNGLFAIYKKQGPTSLDVLNTLKEALLKGKEGGQVFMENKTTTTSISKTIQCFLLFQKQVFRRATLGRGRTSS